MGIYGPRGEEELTEDSPNGRRFPGEDKPYLGSGSHEGSDLGVRVVITRFGVVLGRDGGALSQMTPLFKKFLGGPIGSGVQWFSWIHQADLARAFRFIQENQQLSGPVNLTAPYPVRNRELARALGRVLHRPSFMPTPEFMLRLVLENLPTPCSPGRRYCPNGC